MTDPIVALVLCIEEATVEVNVVEENDYSSNGDVQYTCIDSLKLRLKKIKVIDPEKLLKALRELY